MSYGHDTKTSVNPGGMLPGNIVFEQVQTLEGNVQYAERDHSGKVIIKPFIRVGEYLTYQPLAPSPWILPPPPKTYGSLKDLWKRIWGFIYNHLDLEKDILYDIMVAWVLANWVPERWDSVPYLHFHGPSNSGKTRALDILNYLCYRPLLSPSVSSSSIYRALDAFHPTFLLDEFELYQKQAEAKAEVIGVLNAGYRRGQVVLRTDKVRDGAPTLRGFNVFGFKAIGSILELPATLEGRAVHFPMSRAVRSVKRLIDKAEAQELRAALLQYRFDHVLDPSPTGNPIDLPEGRMIELYLPLATVCPDAETVERMFKYARERHVQMIQKERETEDAKVYSAIIDLLREQPRMYLPQGDIRMKINATLPEKEWWPPQKLGRILRRWELDTRQGKESRLSEVVVNVNILERRKVRYVTLDDMPMVDSLLLKLRGLSSTPLTSFQTSAQDRCMETFVQSVQGLSHIDAQMSPHGLDQTAAEKPQTALHLLHLSTGDTLGDGVKDVEAVEAERDVICCKDVRDVRDVRDVEVEDVVERSLCEKCGKELGKPREGEQWLCDSCAGGI